MAATCFNLHAPEGGFARTLAPGIETRLFSGKHAMLAVVTLASNAAGEVQRCAEEQWIVVAQGSGVLLVGQDELDLDEGDVCLVPSGTPHNFIAGSAGARLLDIVAPPGEGAVRGGGRDPAAG